MSFAARDLSFIGYSSKVFDHHVTIKFSCPVKLCQINAFISTFFILFLKRRINASFQVFEVVKLEQKSNKFLRCVGDLPTRPC